MPSEPAPPTAEELLSQQEWLRRLARSLVGDPHAADDLAQQTALAAMRHLPRAGSVGRGWLARVARNFARLAARGERNRARREEVAARPERLPSANELLERIEIQRVVVEEVLRLAEPYRATLVLRFLENVSAQEIAAAQGVPAGTVRSRVKRGLAILRTRLDARSGGDRTLWLEALAPLSLPLRAGTMTGATGSGLAGGAMLMKKLTAVIVIAAVCLTALWYVAPLGSGGGTDPVVQQTDLVSRPDDAEGREDEAEQDASTAPATIAPTARTEFEVDPGSIRGRLTWEEDGTPIADAEVWQASRPGAGGGYVVGRTGRDGQALVRLTGPTVFLCEIGARKAGYSPSEIRMTLSMLDVPHGRPVSPRPAGAGPRS